MNKHVVIVHEKNKQSICQICDHGFSRKGDLKKHIESVHEKKKSLKCDICDYSSSQKNSL